MAKSHLFQIVKLKSLCHYLANTPYIPSNPTKGRAHQIHSDDRHNSPSLTINSLTKVTICCHFVYLPDFFNLETKGITIMYNERCF